MDEPTTFLFAHDVEEALVSLCFAAPERIAVLKRELDPKVHITRPELCQILEAIDLSYRELGASDFASLICVLRELGQLENCGGKAGVIDVLERYRYGFASKEVEQAIFSHYIEMLRAYARARANKPPVPAYRFNRGDLVLVKNKAKTHERCPDFIGEGKVAGHPYRASAYSNCDQHGQSVLCISLCPK
jgi:hypothetical protein